MNRKKNEIFDQQSVEHKAPPPSSGGLTFEVPDVVVPLPSNGKVYPKTHPLSDKDDVIIGAMTTRQENILTNRSLAKKGTLLTHLVKSALKDPNIDPKDLLTGDRNTIMVALRVSGYGAEYKTQLKCPACGESFSQDFDLSQLPIRRLEIDPINPGENNFSFTLPVSRAEVIFKFLTGVDEETISQVNSQKKKQGIDGSDLVTQGLIHSIVSIAGETERAKIFRIVNNLLAADSRALRKFIQENEPGMQMRGQMECPHCDHSQEVDMPLGANFFWPDA